MPTEAQIIEARVQATYEAYQNMDPKNIRLAARLHNAPHKHILNRSHGIQTKLQRPEPDKKLNQQ
jgi:hypothetical protein